MSDTDARKAMPDTHDDDTSAAAAVVVAAAPPATKQAELSVAVIIPTFNYARFVGLAIESVLRQTYPAREIIVVDDESTDETPAVLARFGNSIRVIRQKNAGVSMALNNGTEHATSDLIAFLDADDVWLPRKLERQVARFQNDSELGLVHCGLEEIDVDGKVLRERLDGQEGRRLAQRMLLGEAVMLGPGSSAVVPRHIVKQVGGFDARIAVAQDWDLSYRVARKYKVGFVPEVLLQYRQHGTNGHRKIKRMEHDIMLCFEKAFAEAGTEFEPLRRRAYGNLHLVLAGSYFVTGGYHDFLRHALKSIVLAPNKLLNLLAYPARRWQRRGKAENTK